MYLIILLLLFESIISVLTGFSYIDELVAVFLLILMVIKWLKLRKKGVFSKKEILSLYSIYIIGAIGILSACFYNYQNNFLLGFEGTFFSLKSFLCYFCYKYVYKYRRIDNKKEKKLLKLIELTLYLLTFIALIDRFILLFPSRGIRFGLHTTALFFNTPTNLAFLAVLILLILSFFRSEKYKNKKVLFFDLICCVFLIIITGRMKAVGFILFLFIFLLMTKFVKKFNITLLIVPTIMILMFASDSIENYYFNKSAARTNMMHSSIEIAKDHPLGSGFSTFGSELSRKYYSPLYYNYGLFKTYGLSKEYPAFICDSQWPAIIGETGIIGLVLTLFVLYNFLTYLPKKIYKKECLFIISAITYLLFESIGDTIFMTSRGCLLMVFLAYITITYEKEDKFERE